MPFLLSGEEGVSSSPFFLAVAAERERILAECTGGLTARQRELLALHYQRGLSLPEIARQWNVSKAAVSRMHQRALHSLQSQLAQRRIAGPGEI